MTVVVGSWLRTSDNPTNCNLPHRKDPHRVSVGIGAYEGKMTRMVVPWPGWLSSSIFAL